MAKFLFLLALLFAAAPRVRAQSCNLSFSSQSQLDDYYKNSGLDGGALCIIANSLSITGGAATSPDRIRNLDNLVALREINGNVSLNLGALDDIEGLRNITRIGGDLYITGATSLNGIGLFANHDLLYNLESVGGNIYILNNPSLVLVSGFLYKLRSAKRIIFQNNDNLFDIRGFGILQKSEAIYFTQNPKLSGIQGFENLQTIEGTPQVPGILSLSNCPQLTLLGGFDSLHDAYEVNIGTNPLLEEVKGFNQLRHANLSIYNNPRLRVIDGFNNALEASQVFINSNPALETITGFRGLKTGMSLSITTNAALREISGFDGGWVTGQLSISNNASLQTITGFRDFSQAPTDMNITQNPLLTSITGFTGTQAPTRLYLTASPALTSLSTSFLYADYSTLNMLYVQGNTSLAACAEPWICQYLRRGGYAVISGNGGGCTQAGILAACQVLAVQAPVAAAPAYPNPVIDVLHLSSASAYTVRDLLGRVLLQGQGALISMTNLPAGVYLVETGKEAKSSWRIVKQ